MEKQRPGSISILCALVEDNMVVCERKDTDSEMAQQRDYKNMIYDCGWLAGWFCVK